MARPHKTIPRKIADLTPVWDTGKAIQLKIQGLSYMDIAKYYNIPKATIQQRLKPYFGKDSINIPAFKTHRADLFAGQQARVLQSISDADIKKASLRDKVISAGVLYDKERLERGESTENVSVSIQGLLDRTKAAGITVEAVPVGDIPPYLRLEYTPDEE